MWSKENPPSTNQTKTSQNKHAQQISIDSSFKQRAQLQYFNRFEVLKYRTILPHKRLCIMIRKKMALGRDAKT